LNPVSILPAPDFDLAATLGCGQVFHWRTLGAGYAGVVGETPLYVEQRGETLLVSAGAEELARRYFALDHPLEEVYATFPDDPAMRAALACCRGVRIIRQPLWECLATFITSALKQVPHIAQISHRLRERFGRRVGQIGGLELFAYPRVERIATLEEAELRACGLGFRARTLLATARTLAAAGGAEELEAIRSLERPAALAALRRYAGVGTKVANCVLLFGYEHLDAFPIDVWIERVLRERYFQDKPETTARRLQEFSDVYFGVYGGYAQQYLFHHARTQAKKRKP
jgi:N-glycosylase/DNA lyase